MISFSLKFSVFSFNHNEAKTIPPLTSVHYLFLPFHWSAWRNVNFGITSFTSAATTKHKNIKYFFLKQNKLHLLKFASCSSSSIII